MKERKSIEAAAQAIIDDLMNPLKSASGLSVEMLALNLGVLLDIRDLLTEAK